VVNFKPLDNLPIIGGSQLIIYFSLLEIVQYFIYNKLTQGGSTSILTPKPPEFFLVAVLFNKEVGKSTLK
jgi:hypothetical protein